MPRVSRQLTDADVYAFGLGLGVRTLPTAPRAGLKAMLLPVEYIRCAEFRYVLSQLQVAPGMRVLDVGSPKLLSLFLAARVGAQVVATDLLDYFFREYDAYARVSLEDRGLYQMQRQDAQHLTQPDASFDRVFSVSVIEHLPGDGDRAAMHEIARVLRPGGVLSMTVPYSDKGYVEDYGQEYWTDPEAGDGAFNYRAYDYPTLRARLVDGVPLTLTDLSFYGERRVPMEDMLLHPRLPAQVRWAMFPFHLPLSRAFVRRLAEAEVAHKKVACLTFRKPDEPVTRPSRV